MKISIGRMALAMTLCISAVHSAHAKPIAFADGTTVMAEYGAGTMTEVQAFYAPSYRYSLGGGHLALNSDLNDDTRDITYLRANFLPKRWNMETAQANVFVWGSVGRAHLRVYVSLRSDLHEGESFSNRIDTLQLGLAPYKHDYETLAVWFVVQGRNYTGGLYDGVEWAGLVRLFKRNAWLEAGLTTQGKVQAMLMFNF
jgi:hypothetical protein